MIHLLLAVIYLSFISLGLPDSLLGAAWPSMYPGFGVPVSYSGVIFCTANFASSFITLMSFFLTSFNASVITITSVLSPT